jgi:hypothetical protein
MSENKETIHDLLDDLSYGKPLDLDSEERVNQEEPQADGDQVPDQDPESQDKPSPEPESKEEEVQEEPEDKPEEAPEEKPKSEEDADTDEAEAPEDKDAEPTIEIDGEQVPLSEIRKWREQGMMREDYSRKTAEISEMRKKALESRKQVATLAKDLSEDPAFQKFLSARPEALAHLMANPEATRQMLGKPQAVKEFWIDYDTVRKNPRLAARLASDDPKDVEEADKELRMQQENEDAAQIVNTLEGFIVQAQEKFYPDLGNEAAEHVIAYVAEMAQVPQEPTRNDVIEGTKRLFNLFYRKQEDGSYTIDPSLIGAEFERVKLAKEQGQLEEPEPDKIAEEHNARVDQQLKDERPPKTPDGLPPAAGQEVRELPDTLPDLLNELQYGK